VLNQGMNLEELRHKEDHSLSGMKFYFMVIVLFVLTLDIKLHIAELMEEMVKKEMHMRLHIILNVTNAITMDIYLVIVES
jgi:hypothetical protein